MWCNGRLGGLVSDRRGCLNTGTAVRWFGCILAMSSVMQGCQKPQTPSNANEEPTVTPPAERPPEPIELPTRVDIGKDMDEPERWLFVTEARERKTAAWASGSFDKDRNKLSIRTDNVERFTVDTSRIPIDWQKLVVIRIDGKNSELRKRDDPVLTFALDEHNRWVVVEP